MIYMYIIYICTISCHPLYKKPVKQENEVTYLVAMGSCGTVSQWERCLDVLSLGEQLDATRWMGSR